MSWRTIVAAALCALGLITAVPAAASAACSSTWTGAASSNDWGTAANWSGNAVPAAGEHVCLPAGAAVTLSTTTSVADIQGAGATLVLNGALTLTDEGTDSNLGGMTVNGRLSGAGRLRVHTTFTWTLGTLAGPGQLVLEPGAQGEIDSPYSSSYPTFDGGTLINRGVLTWKAGSLRAGDQPAGDTHSQLINEGTFRANASNADAHYWSSADVLAWRNEGTVERTAGSGDLRISWRFDNRGVVRSQSGRLAYTGGANAPTSEGIWIGAGGAIEVGGGPGYPMLAHRWTASGEVRLGGQVRVGSITGTADLELTGDLALTDEETDSTARGLSIPGGTVSGPGRLRVSDTFSWTSGTLRGGEIVLEEGVEGTIANPYSYSNYPTFDGGSLVNRGRLTWTGGGMRAGDESTGDTVSRFVNEGTFRANGNSTGLYYWSSADLLRLINTGLIERTAGSGNASVSWRLDNRGTVRSEHGELSFSEGGDAPSSDGTFIGSGTGKVAVAGNTSPMVAGRWTMSGNVQIGGTVSVDGIDGTADVQLVGILGVRSTTDDSHVDGLAIEGGYFRGAGRLRVADAFSWTHGTIGGGEVLLGADAHGSIANPYSYSNSPTLDGGSLVNRGMLTWTGGGMRGGDQSTGDTVSRFVNEGTFRANGNSTGLYYWSSNDRVDFVNTGLVERTAGSGNASVSWRLENRGTVRSEQGELAFSEGANAPDANGTFAGSGGARVAVAGNTSPMVAGRWTLSGDVQIGGAVSVDRLDGTGDVSLVGNLSLRDGAVDSRVRGLAISSGRFDGSGRLRVSDAFSWTYGTLAGGEVLLEDGANGTIANPSSYSNYPTFDGGSLVNRGTLTWTGGGMRGGDQSAGDTVSRFVNVGTFRANGSNSGLYYWASADLVKFVNHGLVERTGGSGSAAVSWEFENRGTVRSEQGELSFSAGADAPEADGNWVGSGGGSVSVSGGTTPFVAGRWTLTGAVNVGGADVAGLAGTGDVTLTGGLTVRDTATDSRVRDLAFTSGYLRGPGRLRVGRAFSWRYGTIMDHAELVLDEGSTGTIAASSSWNPPELAGGTLINRGTLTWASGSIRGGIQARPTTSAFVNEGTFRVTGESGGMHYWSSDDVVAFRNEGTLERTNGAGYIDISWRFDNAGVVRAHSGVLSIAGGANAPGSDGTWVGAAPGKVTVGGTRVAGHTTVRGDVIIGGDARMRSLDGTEADLKVDGALGLTDGAVDSRVRDLYLKGDVSGPGRLRVSGTMVWAAGDLRGPGEVVVDPGAQATISQYYNSDPPMIAAGGSLRNRGKLVLSSRGVTGEPGGLLDNQGRFELRSDTWMSGTGALLLNRGELVKNGGSGWASIGFDVGNAGSIQEVEGKFSFTGNQVGVTPAAAEQYGPGNPAEPNTRRSCAGKPVDCSSGNQFEVHTDLAVGGRGLGLAWTRTYNSQAAATATQPGTLGYGWTHAYGDRLVVEPAERRATVTHADGSMVTFVIAPDGSYVAPPQVQATLRTNGDSTSTYTLPNQVRYRFAGDGRLLSQTDRNGNATTMAYDGDGRLAEVADPAGRKLTLTYENELIASVTDPSGLTVLYDHAGGELVDVRYAGEEDPTWAFDYDGSHQLTHMTDARGGTTVTEYDGQRRATRQTDALNRVRQWEYLTNETKVTEPNGSLTHMWFDGGQPTRITRAEATAAETTTRYRYDDQRRNTEVVDGNGHTTTFTYDAAGNRLSAADPTGRTSRWTYNATRDLLSAESPGGKVTTIERDARGNPTAVSRTFSENGTAKTQRVEMAYDAVGQLTSTKDALGEVTTYEYDAAGNQTAAVDPTGKRSTATFDGLSRVTSTTTPGGHATTITRDRFGRPTKTTDALGRETTTTYDDNGNVVKVIDPAGRETAATYDAENQLLTETLGDGSTRHVAYDAMGAIASRTDGAGHTTIYHHDAAGNITEVADPLDRRTVLRHDAAGNVVERIDALSRSTTFAYDDADRPTRVTYPAPGAREVTYGYDAEGRQVRATDASGDSTFSYDDLGRLAGTQTPAGEQVSYGYDTADRLTRLTYPNGEDVIAAYDDAGRLTSVTDWLGNTTALGYDDDANLVSKDMPGTPADTYAYDAAGGMTGAAFDGATLDYGYGTGGELASVASTGLPGAASETYGYDAAARLSTDGLASLAYDLAGNATRLRGADPLHYDDAGQLASATTPDGEVTYGFDAVGQRTSRAVAGGATTAYGYDSAGELTSVATDSTVDATYGYDALGLRVTKTLAGASSPTRFVWDQAGGSVLSEGDTSYVYAPDGLPLASITESGSGSAPAVRWFHHDRLGSIRSVTDETGAQVSAQTFDAYGNVAATSGSERIPFGFAGRYTDEETGLVQMGARMYDPATGQFLTRDPLEDLTLQPYLYAGGDPVNAIDPTGLFPIRIGLPSLEDVSNAAAGFGDTVTFGGTKKIREALGVDSVVDYCSGAYTGGGYGGTAIGLVIPIERVAGAGVKLVQSERVRGALGRVGKRLADETGSVQPGAFLPSRRNLPRRGKPDSTDVIDRGNGKGQIRDYGPDGQATKDFDFGHDHGAGDPHAHDWINGVRQRGRPIRPGE